MDAERPGALSSHDATPAARLRTAGLRSTRPRRAVLEALDRLGGHRTADELVEAMAHDGSGLPRSTVFAVLDDLAEAGLVDRAAVGVGAARYETAAAEPHHHFVCERCGRLEDLPVDLIDHRIGDLGQVGITISRVDLVARGLCASCGDGASCADGARSAGTPRPD